MEPDVEKTQELAENHFAYMIKCIELRNTNVEFVIKLW